MDSPLPSANAAPSIWGAAVAAPHTKFVGNVRLVDVITNSGSIGSANAAWKDALDDLIRGYERRSLGLPVAGNRSVYQRVACKNHFPDKKTQARYNGLPHICLWQRSPLKT